VARRSVFILAAWPICTILLLAASGNALPQEQRIIAAPGSTARERQQSSAGAQPLIVAFGDSLTAGVAGRSYPDDLQDLLNERRYRYRVENQGVSGDTTSDGLARIENVIAGHPALVILEFGGNDGLRGVPVEAIRKNLEEMIERLKRAKVPLVLLGITLPPNYGSDYVNAFTAMYPDVAKKYNLHFVPFLLMNVYQHPEMMQTDGIHPNGQGNKIVAEDVFKLIQPLLNKPSAK
jgi:acyl-CoA thioesterase-1